MRASEICPITGQPLFCDGCGNEILPNGHCANYWLEEGADLICKDDRQWTSWADREWVRVEKLREVAQ